MNEFSLFREDLSVATIEQVDVIRPEVELADIPDTLGDFSVLKKLIVMEKDPAKVALWLEVGKTIFQITASSNLNLHRSSKMPSSI